MQRENVPAQIVLAGVAAVLVIVGLLMFFRWAGKVPLNASNVQKQITVAVTPPQRRVVLSGKDDTAKVVIDAQTFFTLFGDEIKAASPADPRQKLFAEIKEQVKKNDEVDIGVILKGYERISGQLTVHLLNVMRPLLSEGRVSLYDTASGAYVPYFTVQEWRPGDPAIGTGATEKYLLPNGEIFWEMP
jgi:hypothetical protein